MSYATSFAAAGSGPVGRRVRILVAVAALSVGAVLLLAPAAQAQDPFIGEIRLVPYNFAPRGWAFCEGQLLPIAQNQALFSLLGTTYGGDGRTTFALPDLRGRVAISEGQGPGLSPRILGERGGEQAHTLTFAELPSHSHEAGAHAGNGSAAAPNGLLPARNPAGTPAYGHGQDTVLGAGAVLPAGGNQPHNNMQPYLTLHYIIALQGIFPSRN